MHEKERHRIILAEVSEKPVATVSNLVHLLDVSEATIRRDIAFLHKQNQLRRVRGGAESLHPPKVTSLIGRPLAISQTMNAKAKRKIAKAAVGLCQIGDSIILGGGSTVSMMSEYIQEMRLDVMTNSFLIASNLLRSEKCNVTLPAGKVYREQSLILSPYIEDGSSYVSAAKIFFGAHGISGLGVTEADPLIVQAITRLLKRAEQKVLMIDSSKFTQSSSLVVCALEDIDYLITDDNIPDKSAQLIEQAGCNLMVV